MIPSGNPDPSYDFRTKIIESLEELSQGLGKVQDALQEMQEKLGELIKVL